MPADSTDYLYIKKIWWKSMLRKPEVITDPLSASKFPKGMMLFFCFFMALLFIVMPPEATPGIGTFSCLIGCQRVIEPVLSPLLYKPALKM